MMQIGLQLCGAAVAPAYFAYRRFWRSTVRPALVALGPSRHRHNSPVCIRQDLNTFLNIPCGSAPMTTTLLVVSRSLSFCHLPTSDDSIHTVCWVREGGLCPSPNTFLLFSHETFLAIRYCITGSLYVDTNKTNFLVLVIFSLFPLLINSKSI
jgi:hypothetical protein